MSDPSPIQSITEKHLKAMLDEAQSAGLARDAVARKLLWLVIDIYRETRSENDIKDELEYIADNLDPDGDLPFMRP